MRSLIKQSLSVYKEKKGFALFQKVLRKIYRDSHDKLIAIRGHYSLKLNEITVQFSAPTLTMVRRNRSRFESENQEISDFVNEIQGDDIVYDIGANTGLYSLFAAHKCSEGEVICFEPYPPNLNLLKQEIGRNQLQNIKIVDVALSNSVGKIDFSQPTEADIGYGSASIEANQSKATIEVPTTTGDKLIEDGEIPPPNIVKIDVEGSEPLVIEGLEEVLSNPSCRTIYCEVHLPGANIRPSIEDFGSSLEDIRNRLEEFGFTVERLDSSREPEIFYKAYK